MSIDIPITLSSEPTEIAAEAKPATNEWAATALTAMFAAAAVLFASFLVVVTGLA
jgi:hypothetical protein